MSTKNDTLSSTDFLDYRNYAEELLHNPYRVHNFHLNSSINQPHSYMAPNSLMNASTCSMASGVTGILGLSNYSDCLPPSITATLVKPGINGKLGYQTTTSSGFQVKLDNDNLLKNLSEQGKDLIDDIKTPRLIGSVMKPGCIIEEENVDTFLSNNQADNLENRFQQNIQISQENLVLHDQQQRPQNELFFKSYTSVVSPVKKNLNNNNTITSTERSIGMLYSQVLLLALNF